MPGSPQHLELSSHDQAATRLFTGPMVENAIVLKTVGSDFVAAHSRPDLGFPVCRDSAMPSGLNPSIELREDHALGVGKIGVLGPPLLLLLDTGRNVKDAGRVLVLVAVLPASAGSGKPFNPEVSGLSQEEPLIDLGIAPQDRNRHCGRVDASASFGGRDALDTMAAAFSEEFGEVFALNLDGYFVMTDPRFSVADNAGLSGFAESELFVRLRQIAHEQLGVIAALGGMDFDNPFHFDPPNNAQILNPFSPH